MGPAQSARAGNVCGWYRLALVLKGCRDQKVFGNLSRVDILLSGPPSHCRDVIVVQDREILKHIIPWVQELLSLVLRVGEYH